MSFYTEVGGDRLTTPPVPQVDAQSASNMPYNIHKNIHTAMSPAQSPSAPKSVAFELLVQNMPQFKARLPMRVQIFPHDTTESIISTVKNFYGLYGSPGLTYGVSFEDVHGNTLIARYENLHDKMNVYIRVIENIVPASNQFAPGGYQSGSAPGQSNYWNGEHQMLPPQSATTRPDSRASNGRSVSPGRGRRSGSASTNQKNRKPRSGGQSRGSSTHGSFADIYSDGNGYSSGDGAPGSVSSRSRGDVGQSDISVANIVEGGRRKRAKFESSELPLFAPPQMPAATSNSSVSPVRRMDQQRAAMPFTHPGQHAFAHPHVLQSAQSYNSNYAASGPFVTPNNAARHSGANFSNHRGSISNTPSNLLPTPDPTIGSCMSEEDKDVALQLMRLGAMSNQSHARTSTSTMDDTFSGRAAASSTGATSDGESDDDELLPARRQRLDYSPILPPGVVRRLAKPVENLPASQDSTEMSGEEFEDGRDGTFKPENGNGETFAGFVGEMPRSRQTSVAKPRTKSGTAKPKTTKAPRSSNGVAKTKTSKNSGTSKSQPMSPASMSNHSRKTSVASALNFQHQLGEDEEDLSSKPRCQRCRKSKKGCDRQRPCQRCKDAGLSAEQCVSEDEGNGRKGRYGRHMGVKVKKEEGVLAGQGQFYARDMGAPMGMEMLNTSSPDKSKKRKR